jgi:hypothetical protein
VESSKDIEERVGLSSLLETITAVLSKVKEMEAEQAALSQKDEELTMDQVKRRMQEIQAGQEAVVEDDSNRNFGAFAVKEDKKDTFRAIMQRFQVSPPPPPPPPPFKLSTLLPQ